MSCQPDALCACPRLFPQAALARRVPWSDQYASTPLNPDIRQLYAEDAADAAPLACVRLAFTLCYLPGDQAGELLKLALKAAQLVLVADFKLAERNLELPAAIAAHTLMALTGASRLSRANRPPHRNYMQTGGIEGLARQSRALVLDRRPFFAGAAVLLYLQIPSR